tara:strand:+ start:28 stop:204 length:177 start_codon:yes stop_codon:yes gene_type:complete
MIGVRLDEGVRFKRGAIVNPPAFLVVDEGEIPFPPLIIDRGWGGGKTLPLEEEDYETV